MFEVTLGAFMVGMSTISGAVALNDGRSAWPSAFVACMGVLAWLRGRDELHRAAQEDTND